MNEEFDFWVWLEYLLWRLFHKRDGKHGHHRFCSCPSLPAAPSNLRVTIMPHSVVLTWVDSPDGGAVNVFRGSAAGQEGTTPLNATPIALGVQTFTDSSPALGANFYTVEAVVNGVSSVPSNEVNASIAPAAPSNLAVTSAS